ncbi:hypothetical protein [Dysosmobacter sp. HCP28S3_G4]|uniref:hypothetical protein n=1 Tax=Dysosmobacter sp. HCP28S3_G4 TaxID=3438938 RepID=UPI003F8AA679
MEQSKFYRRGWLCAALSPVACVLFLLGGIAGLWDQTGNQLVTVLAGILTVEMLVGTIAPFWWLLTAFRQRRLGKEQSAILIFANAAALIISIVFFF